MCAPLTLLNHPTVSLSARWEKSGRSPWRWEEGNEDDEKEKHCQVRTARCLGRAACPESWRTLEKMRHKERPDLHSVLWLHFLLCLFTHTLPGCVFVSFCVSFLFLPICHHNCCSGSACFSNMFYVFVLYVFISGVSLSLTRLSQNLLDIQGNWASSDGDCGKDFL